MVSFSSPHFGLAALAIAVAAISIAGARRIDLSILSACLLATGAVLLAIAAAGPVWNRPKHGSMAVMVDLSPSTRGADFRNRDGLEKRVRELIGDKPYQLIAFAGENRALKQNDPLDEMPTDQTRFSPVSADAIVLFSDGQFDLPKTSPPVYVAVDEGLENPSDACVERLELRGQTAAATIRNTGAKRQASFQGTSGPTTLPVDPGTFVVSRPLAAEIPTVSVKLNAGDLWPENDSLSTIISAPIASQKWWVGENPPGGEWRSFSPERLPDLEQEYLAAAVIILDDQAAEGFAPSQLDRLMQFVRDLGGSVLIVGADHAFAPGGYEGTFLEQISPLASSPPTPTTRWVLLADGSGSMSQSAGVGSLSRWDIAVGAVTRLLPWLPPADVLQIGQFSDVVRWWCPAHSAADAARLPLPPADAEPHGPTNLESALNQIAIDTDPVLPTELLLLSDCDVQVDHPDQLSDLLRQKKIRLHVVAIAPGSGLEVIRKIVAATDGRMIEQLDPRQWLQSIRELSQAALPARLMRERAAVTFENEAKSVKSQTVSLWARTWLKPQARRWASATRADVTIPMAAYWRVGSGCVAAVAFQPDESQIESLAALIAAKPRDPRFSVRWETGRRIHVIVKAIEAAKFLNNLRLSLELQEERSTRSIPVEQTAPGQYEVTMDYRSDPQIATLRMGEETLDRISLPGRYPPEFDAIGNDHAAMRELAENSGGEVIWPADHVPIDFHWPEFTTPLTAWICAAGLLFITAGLARWRMGRLRLGDAS